MKAVESSTISHIGFEDGKLHVRFKSSPKHVYEYDATAEEYKAFMAADSKGSHHHKNFKGRPFEKREE
jgi:hypothetical protein